MSRPGSKPAAAAPVLAELDTAADGRATVACADVGTKAADVAALPGFSECTAAVLAMLLGAGEAGELRLEARTLDGIGTEVVTVQVVNGVFLPPLLLALLEGRRDWVVAVRPAVHTYGGLQLLRQNCVFARWRLAPEFGGSGWVVPSAQLDAVERAVQAFPLRPSAIIDGGVEVAALWKLEIPLSLVAPARARALALQRRLAVALGASTADCTRSMPSQSGGPSRVQTVADDDPLGYLPLAGIVREMPGPSSWPLVRTIYLDAAAVYSIAAVEAALPCTNGDQR